MDVAQRLYAAQDSSKLYIGLGRTGIGLYNDFYIDSDNNPQTGMRNANWPNSGADYMVEGASLYKWDGKWTLASSIAMVKTDNAIEMGIDLIKLGSAAPNEIKVAFANSIEVLPAIGSKMVTTDLVISGLNPPPTPPGNISAVPSNTKLTYTWDKVNLATGYDVEINGVVVQSTTDTNYVYGGQAPGTQVTFRVRAKNTDSTGDWSDPIIKSTLSPVAVKLVVDGNIADWANITPLATGNGLAQRLYAAQDSSKLYIGLGRTGIGLYNDFYIDSDNNPQTGMRNANWPNSGADYMVEGASLYKWDGKWTLASSIVMVKTDNAIEMGIDLSKLGLSAPNEIKVAFANSTEVLPAIGSKMVTTDLVISGLNPPPTPPGNISAVASNTKLTYTWDKINLATGYDVK